MDITLTMSLLPTPPKGGFIYKEILNNSINVAQNHLWAPRMCSGIIQLLHVNYKIYGLKEGGYFIITRINLQLTWNKSLCKAFLDNLVLLFVCLFVFSQKKESYTTKLFIKLIPPTRCLFCVGEVVQIFNVGLRLMWTGTFRIRGIKLDCLHEQLRLSIRKQRNSHELTLGF